MMNDSVFDSGKVCSKCKEWKTLDNFYARPEGKYGVFSWCKDCYKAKNLKWHTSNPERSMLARARQRAKRDGYPCTITESDIVIPTHCPVLGLPLKRSTTGKVSPNSPSLDKIIPELGYVPGNVVVISNRANSIKQNATYDEIEAVADWLKRQRNAITDFTDYRGEC